MDLIAPEPQDDLRIVLAREQPFRLGAAEVRPASREVAGPRGREVLEPRVMQVLVALAKAEGGVLTRDLLIASCWDGRAVSDDAISRVIARIRRLSEGRLGDGWSLETITKVGYRLLQSGHAAAAALPGPGTPATPAPSSRRLLLGAGIAGAVAVAAGAGVATWRLRTPAASPRAEGLYERGRDALSQGLPAENARAIGFLKAAVEDSPRYAAAWGSLALAYHGSLMFTPPSQQGGVVAQSQGAARRALELQRDEPEATAALALLTPVYRNWDKAEQAVRHALALHPDDPRLEIAYNKFLLGVGRIKGAIAAGEIAVAGDLFAPWYPFGLTSSLWAAGRTEEAEQALRKALALWPRHHALWFLLFDVLAYSGRPEEALAMAADIGARPATIPAPDIELHLVAARALASGAAAETAAAVKMQNEVARRGVGYAENAIWWLTALGRLDDAFAVARGMYFDEGFSLGAQRFSAEQRRFMTPRSRNTHLLFMPPAAPLRRDPRFGVLVRDIGLVRYWQRSGHKPDDPAWAWGGLG